MLSASLQKVLDLQPHYALTLTPEMRERTALIERAIVEELSDLLENHFETFDWKIKGSNGMGYCSVVPWVRLYKQEFSPKATSGYYLVFLFSTDGKFVHLTLNQGTSKSSKAEAIARKEEAQRVILSDSTLQRQFQSRIENLPEMDLGNPTGLAKSYIFGDIVHVTYASGSIPPDEKIIEDVISLLTPLEKIYHQVSSSKQSKPVNIEDLGSFDMLTATTHWNKEDLRELIYSLSDQSPQVVLAGPPGTGKTFVARQVAAHILGTPGDVQNPAISIVQFHPSYGYEQFIEGLQPVSNESGNFDFQNVAGEIVRLVEKIEEDGLPRVLIIDEMNRANLPRVFGELMYLLEYRDSEINLMYREAFSLPRELYIIGTMNTADRSTRSIDIALRRRFDFFEVFPDVSILRAHYESGQNSNSVGEELYSGFEELNRRLTERLSKHFTVGHSYFMQKDFSVQDLRRIWKHQVFPLIEEYFFSSPTELDNFPIKDFFPSV